MIIKIIAVGKRMPDWITCGYENFIKRLPREITLNLTEISPGQRSKTSNTGIELKKEAEKILPVATMHSKIIVLDETGKTITSQDLADKLIQWQNENEDPCIIIGGADGLDQSVKAVAHETWSLSGMTLPHAIARLLLAEQIYRAWTINTHHPYHRE